MNKKSCILVGITVISTISFAQKKQFTIAEATNGMATTLAPKSVKNPSWQPGTAIFWQMEKRNDTDMWSSSDLTANAGTAPSVAPAGKLPGDNAAITDIKWISKQQAYCISGKNVMLGTLSGSSLSWAIWASLPEQAENIAVDKSKKIAYTVDNNLWLYDKDKVQVTTETNRDIVSGKSVHRQEFGIDRGIFFSPQGTYMAYYRMDQSMVKDYPVVQWNTTPATVYNIKYPMAGGTSHQVTLCVYDPATGKTVTMKTGTTYKDHYLTSVTWSPDEKYIYIAILNRAQNHLILNQYDARSGEKIKTLFTESDPKYVHPMHALTFIPGSNNEFIWWSERDGYAHLYLYNTQGRLLRKLTGGKWVVNEIAGIDTAAGNVIITAAKESPLEKHIYTASLHDGTIKRIDIGAGMHTALCSEDGKYVLDVYNGAGVPKTSRIYATDGPLAKELIKAPDPLADYDRAIIRNVTITAADGLTPLYGKLILPPRFDSTKKYPVIVQLYNGPGVQLIHNSFPESGNLWYEYLAQHGYIIFTMDGRGSLNRGIDFEQVTFHKLGEMEMRDQLKGVAYLKSLPYTDTARLGVYGWSFGGFMTTSLMLKHPGVFKCAVAGGPVIDWKMYEVMYTERYMGTPQNNPQGYANANLLDKVKNLNGRLMLIHGTSDTTVVWQQSIDFIKKCVDENVQVDYFVYPGYEHNVRGKDRVHLMQKISDYFDDHLKNR